MSQQLRYTVSITWSDEDQAYIASVPDLPGCVADGPTYAEAAASVEVVMGEWIETAAALEREIPSPGASNSRYPLRGTNVKYDDPTAPVAEDEWSALHANNPADE